MSSFSLNPFFVKKKKLTNQLNEEDCRIHLKKEKKNRSYFNGETIHRIRLARKKIVAINEIEFVRRCR